MTDTYLNLNGLGCVAEYVNKKEPKIFKGTAAEWDALTTAEKNEFGMCIIDDDFSEVSIDGEVVNVVAEDNPNAVSSGAVFASITSVIEELSEKPTAITFVEDDEDYTPPAPVTVGTGETFDTITAVVNNIDNVYGLGKTDDTYTRMIHPDGSVTSLSGF